MEEDHSLVARQKAWCRRKAEGGLEGALSFFGVSALAVLEYQGLEHSGSLHGVDQVLDQNRE